MSEFDLHRFAVEALRHFGTKGVVALHPANGEVRSKRTGARLKAMGVLPGASDLIVVLPGGRVAFLELKAPGGHLSAAQRVFRASVEGAGAPYAVASTPEGVVSALMSWDALRCDPLRQRRAA